MTLAAIKVGKAAGGEVGTDGGFRGLVNGLFLQGNVPLEGSLTFRVMEASLGGLIETTGSFSSGSGSNFLYPDETVYPNGNLYPQVILGTSFVLGAGSIVPSSSRVLFLTSKIGDASLASTGNLSLRSEIPKSGEVTPAGSQTNKTRLPLTGDVAPAGVVQNREKKTVDGGILPVGVLSISSFSPPVSYLIYAFGGITPSGYFRSSKSLQLVTGTISPAGLVKKLYRKSLLGGSGTYGSGTYGSGSYGGYFLTGILSNLSPLGLFKSGVITPAGSNKKRILRPIQGTVTPAGVNKKRPRKRPGGTITPAGTVARVKTTAGGVAPTLLEGFQAAGNPGLDTAASGSFINADPNGRGSASAETTIVYQGSRSMKSTGGPGSGGTNSSFARLNFAVSIPTNADFWMGQAVYLASNYYDNNSSQTRLCSWSDYDGTDQTLKSGLFIDGSNDALTVYRIVEHNGGVGEEFTQILNMGVRRIPVATWAFMELHFKLSGTAGVALTEVYMNNVSIGSTTVANIRPQYARGNIRRLFYGLADSNNSSVAAIVYSDRCYWGTARLGSV